MSRIQSPEQSNAKPKPRRLPKRKGRSVLPPTGRIESTDQPELPIDLPTLLEPVPTAGDAWPRTAHQTGKSQQ
jgi:hypothetical protein